MIDSEPQGTIPLPKIIYQETEEDLLGLDKAEAFALKVNPEKLAALLQSRGFSPAFIRNLTVEITPKKSWKDKIRRKVLGSNIAASADSPKLIKVRLGNLNQSLTDMNRMIAGFFEGRYSWTEDISATQRKTRLFSPEQVVTSYFSGDPQRRKNYLETAKTGMIDLNRARDFMKKQTRRAIQRKIREDMEHEFNHSAYLDKLPEDRKKLLRFHYLEKYSVQVITGLAIALASLTNKLVRKNGGDIFMANYSSLIVLFGFSGIYFLGRYIGLKSPKVIEEEKQAVAASKVREKVDEWVDVLDFVPLANE